jgi:hypothetical protein
VRNGPAIAAEAPFAGAHRRDSRIALSQASQFASDGALSQLVLEWKIDRDVRPGPGSAIDADRAAQSLDAVGQAGQAGSACGIGPPTPSSRTDSTRLPSRGKRNLNTRCLRMLHRVRQRLILHSATASANRAAIRAR